MREYAEKQSVNKKLPAREILQESRGQLNDSLLQMASLLGNQGMLAFLEQQKESKPSATGKPLSDALREKFERKSGVPLDDVRVHYNSDKPEQLGAEAYAQGNEIHIGLEHEQDLEHEIGHVVQQKQGLVKPTQKIGKLAVNDDKALEQRAGTQLEASRNSSNNGIADDCHVIQFSCKGALEKLTAEQLPKILQSYSMTEEEITTIVLNFGALRDGAMDYWSIPQIVKKCCGEDRAKKIAAQVKANLIISADTASATSTVSNVELKRADTRSPQEIFNAGGFFGREDAPITVEHARRHVQEICNPTWVQKWKSQTKGPKEIVPYVATGSEDQKGGNVYTIKIPLSFPAASTAIKPVLGSDTGDLETATIIALKMRGDEVVFLTGIPNIFIWYGGIPIEDFVKKTKESPSKL